MESTWKFVIHVIVGAAQFLMILLVALALAGVVKAVELLDFTPVWLVEGIERVEKGVFWADVFAFGLFLVTEILTLAAGLWREVVEAWRR